MVSTIDEIKRNNLQDLFEEILKENRLRLMPKTIECFETTGTELTIVTFTYEEILSDHLILRKFADVEGKGFIDCVFKACNKHYNKEYTSLKNIKLVDLLITPVFGMRNIASAAKANVVLSVEVSARDRAEFRNRSDSVIASSYAVALAVFEFYINCERSFRVLKLSVQDAKKRNRADLMSLYLCKMSSLTEANTYA